MKVIAIILAAAVGYVQATTYAQFCNDHACQDGCGISVSVDNPGCLNENGRGSGGNIQSAHLVFSPTPNCPCQNECIEVVRCGEGQCGGVLECQSLEGHHDAQSFRFVGGDRCDANNC